MPTPDEILERLRVHWTGTEDELEAALEAFFHDIRGSVELALTGRVTWSPNGETRAAILTEVDDYVANHYFA